MNCKNLPLYLLSFKGITNFIYFFNIFFQHSHLCNYLSDKGYAHVTKRIRRLKPDYLKMSWQTVYNSTDCGIFLMRHMETFKGDVKNWEIDFVEEGVRV